MEPSLQAVIQGLYDSKIHVGLSSVWDGEWNVKIGDPQNGFRTEWSFEDLDDAKLWLISQANRLYPKSEFAKHFEVEFVNSRNSLKKDELCAK